MKYRPEIDGLRAVAVIPVILFHMGFTWMSGGYIGVDVFFVLSGFLITSILQHEFATGTFSFRAFWSRRIRRILPALLAVSAVTLIVAWGLAFRPDRADMGRQGTAALLSAANFWFWQTAGDYWGTQAEESPFLHTWSLSVEEQFYLIFPFLLWLVFRFRPQWLSRVLAGVILISLPLFLLGLSADPTATFYLLPTRAWELAAGGWLAVVLPGTCPESASLQRCRPLAMAGLFVVVGSFFVLPALSSGLVFAILGTVLVIAFGQSGPCYSLLSHRSMVHIGKISYSLYLWHWPVLVFADDFGFDWHPAYLLVPIYLLAVASWLLIERPARLRARTVPVAGCGYVLVLGFAFLLIRLPGEYDTAGFETPCWYGCYYDLKPRNELGADFEQFRHSIEIPEREAAPDAFRHGGIIFGDDGSAPQLVVLGDSHGVMWSDAIREVAEDHGICAAFISMNGVSPFLSVRHSPALEDHFLTADEKADYDQSRMQFIRDWRPKLVILCCRWSVIPEAATTDLLTFLEHHAQRVLLLEQPPELEHIGNRNAMQYLVYRGLAPQDGVTAYLPAGNSQNTASGRALIRSLAARHRNCAVLPVYDLFARESEALVLDGRNMVYIDDDHLTTHGSHLARPRIEQAIADAFGNDAIVSVQR